MAVLANELGKILRGVKERRVRRVGQHFQFGFGQVRREPLRRRQGHQRIVRAVNEQRRRGDSRDCRTQVDVAQPGQALEQGFDRGRQSRLQLLVERTGEATNVAGNTTAPGQAPPIQAQQLTGELAQGDTQLQSGEFIVDRDGRIRLAYVYNYCEDYPDPAIFLTAARLAAAT